MGILNVGLQSIAQRRAKTVRTIEKIMSEAVEAEADDAFQVAVEEIHPEDDPNPLGITDADELLDLIPDETDETEVKEINTMLASQEEEIDLDDILGIVEV